MDCFVASLLAMTVDGPAVVRNRLICPTGKSLVRFSPLAMRPHLDHRPNPPARKSEFCKPLQYVSEFQGLSLK
jgi:hypothetical protein